MAVADTAGVIGPPTHLRVYRRGDSYIIFNPTVPTWIYTNAVGAIVVKLLDGLRSMGDIADICARNGVSRDSVLGFFREAGSNGLFDVRPPSARWDGLDWHARKIQSIYLHLTNKCNLSCSYCYRNSSPRIAIKHFGPEFIGFLENARPFLARRPKITFSGGEPMIHPDFFAMAEYCYDNGFRCELLTNGTYITSDNAALVAKYFRYVKISLDGASEETHSKTRGPGNFAKVIESIHLLAAYEGIQLNVQMTVNRDNLAECQQLRSLMPANVNAKFTPAMPMGRGKIDDTNYISNAEFVGIQRDIDVLDGRGAQKVERDTRTFGCHAGIASLSISDRGDVYPCHLFHKPEFRLGNIFIDGIDSIFFSEQNYHFSKSMDVEENNARCGSCDFRYLCGGGCKANPLHAHGDYRKSDTYCGFIRNSLLDSMFATAPKNAIDAAARANMA